LHCCQALERFVVHHLGRGSQGEQLLALQCPAAHQQQGQCYVSVQADGTLVAGGDCLHQAATFVVTAQPGGLGIMCHRGQHGGQLLAAGGDGTVRFTGAADSPDNWTWAVRVLTRPPIPEEQLEVQYQHQHNDTMLSMMLPACRQAPVICMCMHLKLGC
jgi:hypothetical protein